MIFFLPPIEESGRMVISIILHSKKLPNETLLSKYSKSLYQYWNFEIVITQYRLKDNFYLCKKFKKKLAK